MFSEISIRNQDQQQTRKSEYSSRGSFIIYDV